MYDFLEKLAETRIWLRYRTRLLATWDYTKCKKGTKLIGPQWRGLEWSTDGVWRRSCRAIRSPPETWAVGWHTQTPRTPSGRSCWWLSCKKQNKLLNIRTWKRIKRDAVWQNCVKRVTTVLNFSSKVTAALEFWPRWRNSNRLTDVWQRQPSRAAKPRAAREFGAHQKCVCYVKTAS